MSGKTKSGKLKTHRGAAKRFKKTAKGGFRHKQSFRNHMLSCKSTKQKRHLRGQQEVAACDVASINDMLGC